MHKITKKVKLADQTYMVSVHHPEIAKKIKPGQFLILRIAEDSEPLRMDYHGGNKTAIDMVFEENDRTMPLLSMKKGNTIHEIVGPLGTPIDLSQYTTVCLLGSGAGIASIYTLAESIKNRNNRIITILGGKTKKHLYWDDKLEKVSDHTFFSTEDGSKGRKGSLDLALKDLLKKRIDAIYIASEPAVMKEVSRMTNQFVKTFARVPSTTLDGLGISGSDMIVYDNQHKLCCIEGPDMDAHKVGWEFIIAREEEPFTDKSIKKGK